MPSDREMALGFFGDAVDKILLVAGFFLLIVAVGTFSKTYQFLSFGSFLLGIFLIVFGAVLHFESFKLKVPSREGWGTILICASAEFMAAAVGVFLFAVPGNVSFLPTSFRPGADYIMVVDLARPNAWLAPILFSVGLGLLIFGFVLKFQSDIF